jgi:asparagine synthase (glutamine-hydrolysing)
VKPHWSEVDEGHGTSSLRFASSLPALVAAGGVDTDIDPVALHHYLSFHSVVPAPHKILRGVRKLPPGTIIRIEPDGRRSQETYWEPVFERSAELANWSEPEASRSRSAERSLISTDASSSRLPISPA